ncbi:hypothetical protein P7C70_g6135, partial [Phenoliferia sp. Uapishka_3]
MESQNSEFIEEADVSSFGADYLQAQPGNAQAQESQLDAKAAGQISVAAAEAASIAATAKGAAQASKALAAEESKAALSTISVGGAVSLLRW